MRDDNLDRFPVSVAPGMQTYKLLQKLPYNVGSAFAEFVDNALQSFMDNRPAINQDRVEPAKLRVRISIDSEKNSIVIEDNANGIQRGQFERALAVGLDSSFSHGTDSLSAYGIGMKSAAIWLSNEWTIETSTRGADEKFTTIFDLDYLLHEKRDEIEVEIEKEETETHYTKITILNVLRQEDEEHYRDVILPRLLETFFKFKEFLDLELIYDSVKLATDRAFLKTPTPLYYPEVDKNGLHKTRQTIEHGRRILTLPLAITMSRVL